MIPKIVTDLRAIADASRRQDGSDIPLGQQLREAASRISQQDAELERLKAVIAWANNSLFGSHGFFLSLDGGEPDEHHLDRTIEDLKARNRAHFAQLAEARKAAFIEAATEIDEYAATATAMWQSEKDADRAAAHLAQSYAFQSAAKAIRAKAEETPHG